MNAEFNWWLLLVGLVIGAGLAWLVLDDRLRPGREALEDAELEQEADWIGRQLADAGRRIEPEAVADVLRLHDAYTSSLSDGWTPPPSPPG